ncbi:MAG: hypothetical protein ACRD1C_14370 [Terriglobales bacterium]
MAARGASDDEAVGANGGKMAIAWQRNPDDALAAAKESGKLTMVDFSAAPS